MYCTTSIGLTFRSITAIVQSLHNLYPAVTFRHWNFWYHLFTAAVCFSTVVLLAPRSLLSPFAISELQVIVDLFAQAPVGSRPRANLDALIKIQQKTQERFNAASAPSQSLLDQMTSVFGVPSVGSSAPEETFDEGVDTHVAMMGWDTRLVRRLHAGAESRGVSIPRPGPPAHSQSTREPAGSDVQPDLHTAHEQPAQTSIYSIPLWADLPGVSTRRLRFVTMLRMQQSEAHEPQNASQFRGANVSISSRCTRHSSQSHPAGSSYAAVRRGFRMGEMGRLVP